MNSSGDISDVASYIASRTLAPEQPPYNVAVEVLVGCQQEHNLRSRAGMARQQPIPYPVWIKPGFILLTNGLPLLAALL